VADADPWIRALRATHDTLAATVAGFDRRALTRPSSCDQWDVSCVLGHLGSGAEIGLGGLDAARDGVPSPSRDRFPGIWARWDAMSPDARRDGFLDVDERLVATYESLDDAARATMTIRLGFLPEALDVRTIVGFRLSELALHSWDVRTSVDRSAALDPSATALLLGDLPGAVGYLGRAELAARPAVVAVRTNDPTDELTLTIGEAVALEPGRPNDPDATLALPAETLLRLVAGRLPADRTERVTLESTRVDLADLRAPFPGY
jgi:uncharacterized protein (TIGR03083 family)